MTLIDTRFLRPHPDTVVWWGQRKQCRACAHHMYDGGTRDAERCKLQPNPQGKGGPRSVDYGYCIDARHEPPNGAGNRPAVAGPVEWLG